MRIFKTPIHYKNPNRTNTVKGNKLFSYAYIYLSPNKYFVGKEKTIKRHLYISVNFPSKCEKYKCTCADLPSRMS